MSDIGTTIKRLRKDRNLTQDELAEKAGITKSAISRYESGKRQPTIDTLGRLANAFGVNILDILDENSANATPEDKQAATLATKMFETADWRHVHSAKDGILLLGDEVMGEDLYALHTYADKLNHKGLLLLIEYAKALATIPGLMEGPEGEYIGSAAYGGHIDNG